MDSLLTKICRNNKLHDRIAKAFDELIDDIHRAKERFNEIVCNGDTRQYCHDVVREERLIDLVKKLERDKETVLQRLADDLNHGIAKDITKYLVIEKTDEAVGAVVDDPSVDDKSKEKTTHDW